MKSIESAEEILNYRPKGIRNVWFFIHLLFLIFLLIVFLRYPLETRLEYIGSYQNHLIQFMVDEEFFEVETKRLEIQNEKYDYEIETVEPVLYEDGIAKMWKVTIRLDLKERC